MGTFSKSHNIVKRQLGIWRSIHGYGAAQIVNGRLLLCGYDVSLHLWRDAKYDGILECNGTPFRIEIKSTGITSDPDKNPNQEFTFSSGVRSGKQINKNAPSREAVLNKNDSDFAIGVNSHNGQLWIVPVELLALMKRKGKIKCSHSDIFKEKLQIFKGLQKSDLSSDVIRNGFLEFEEQKLEELCKNNSINISNNSKINKYKYPWDISKKIDHLLVNYKESLILDIWKFIYSKI